MALTSTQLIGYQRAEFAVAANRRLFLIFLQFAVALPSAAAVFFNDDLTSYWLAALGVVLLIFWVICDASYRKHREAAERGRRATLLIDGLGEPVSADELAILKEGFFVSDADAAKWEDGNYFYSSAPPGPARLAQMLAESAFWTSRLQGGSSKIMWVIFCVIVGSATLVGIFAFPITEQKLMITAARVFLAFLAFLLSSDVWGAIQGHKAASESIELIRARLRTAKANGYPLCDVLLAMNDYNAAVEGAPMNVPFAYKIWRSRLNKEWQDLNS